MYVQAFKSCNSRFEVAQTTKNLDVSRFYIRMKHL